MDVALRNPRPWVWIVAGLVFVVLVLAPAFLILIHSGLVVVQDVPTMGGPSLLIYGLVMVAGVGILIALFWPMSRAPDTAGRKTG